MRQFIAFLCLAVVSQAPAWGKGLKWWQARVHRISDQSMPYRLFVPPSYTPTRKYPLMLTLHGAGQRGNDNVSQLALSFNRMWADSSLQAAHPAFVLAPQCPLEGRWVDVPWSRGSYSTARVPLSDELRAVVAILDSLGREFSLDPRRIYVSGLSMGGYGAWDLAARFPNRFAAAVPVCGGGDPTRAGVMAGLPVWAFHAEDDEVVPVAGTRAMVAALRAAGGHPRYTEYASRLRVGHRSWEPAAGDPALPAWVHAQRRAEPTGK